MKKTYVAPALFAEQFETADVITVSPLSSLKFVKRSTKESDNEVTTLKASSLDYE